MQRFLKLAIGTAAAVLAMASPAMAHDEITPSTFPTGKPTFLTLTVANEKKVDLTKVTVGAPPGVPFGTSTRQTAGWAPQRVDTQITWTGGKVTPDNFEQWGFEIEGAGQPGALRYTVTMGFADGAAASADVEVTAVAPGAGAPATTVTTAPGTPPTVTASTAPTGAPATKPSSSDDGLAVAALIVALLGGLLAGVALIVSMRRRAGAGAGPDPETSVKGQDW